MRNRLTSLNETISQVNQCDNWNRSVPIALQTHSDLGFSVIRIQSTT